MDYELKRRLRVEHYLILADLAQKQANECLELSAQVYQQEAINIWSALAKRKRKSKAKSSLSSYQLRDQYETYQIKANEYARRADFIANDPSIRSNDPHAIEKLKLRLLDLEARKQAVKDEIRELKQQGQPVSMFLNPAGFNRAIRRTKERIYKIEQIQKASVSFCIHKKRSGSPTSGRGV